MATPFLYYPLGNSRHLDPLFEAIGDAQFVLLGEASHGTHEYYTWRTAITKRLIEEKNFRFIGAEGDWPDCYKIHRFIKGYENSGTTIRDVLMGFRRWPTWMWANWEIAALAEWLQGYNQLKPEKNKIGFYGLDVYSLWESLNTIVDYLEQHDGVAIEAARKAFRCFERYYEKPQEYARATVLVSDNCRDEVVNMLRRLREKSELFENDAEAEFNMEQNALVAVNAEKYYRAMIRGGANSWNVRDQHMVETLDRLTKRHDNAKSVVWEHNTHVGDARYTDMKRDGMFNVGQLVRENYGRNNTFIVGFGSYSGSVIAGRSWNAPMQIMNVPEARKNSWETKLHKISPEDKLILSSDLEEDPETQKWIDHRAIGVVYHPEFEAYGNYVPSLIPERYDAFIFIDRTTALHPLHLRPDLKETPGLYPWNF
ncbi:MULTISPECIES: erythromycin esterase family protein [Nitrosomonas]|uniref:Erythromycin esterase-like protein n=1 Tax=Nitrosomonas communis TaxID=44574 RepID=A0A0F7KEP0_9PROT|nr:MULTISPECIES: erythromycin esterase family protein [Nitrosomonas]AKH37628.1 protein-L-isoaspartate O-methyltransferase [Nitrosomonas communis]TYP74440.1 erythromycin esterase-like protein [Nitrosomonas communis]UVS62923.1 erythromycin esterase family protein [Nitrosomonas sp. PLL12]